MRAISRSFVIVVFGIGLALAPGAVAGRVASGVQGRVLAGPTCPVERPGDPACAPRPVRVTLSVSTPRHGVIRTIRTNSDGFFALALRPGAYVLKPRALSGILPVGRAVLIHVKEGRTTRVTLMMDTGIR